MAANPSIVPFYSQDASDPQISALKLPPHSIEAEQSVLGGLLLNNEAWDRIGDIVGDEDFYRDDHRRIYRHISKLIENNKPADVLTVAESLQLGGELQGVGGRDAERMQQIGALVAQELLRDQVLRSFTAEELTVGRKTYEIGDIRVVDDGIKVQLR